MFMKDVVERGGTRILLGEKKKFSDALLICFLLHIRLDVCVVMMWVFLYFILHYEVVMTGRRHWGMNSGDVLPLIIFMQTSLCSVVTGRTNRLSMNILAAYKSITHTKILSYMKVINVNEIEPR